MPGTDISRKYIHALGLFFYIISCVERLANPVMWGPRPAQNVATSKLQPAQTSIFFPFGPKNYLLVKDYIPLPADMWFFCNTKTT